MLHQELQRGDYVAIAGMGGVGKTELATQYARRYEKDYGGIAWFNDRESNLAAEVLEFFRLQFGFEISQKLGGRLLNLKEQVAWCWSKYPNSALPILIVFDDVTDLANLREVIPNDNRFRVLITTRLRNLDPNFIQEIPLDVLSPQKEPGKAFELLKRLLGKKDRRVENQPQAAIAICECLEYLPLGIELVGAYLVRDPEISLDIMFERLQERKLAEEALQDRETLNSTQLGVKAAFALTWEELDPLAQQLGKFLSLFSPALILWNLVIGAATDGGKLDTWSKNQLKGAKRQLYKRNLLQLVEEREGCYKIHALVRWFLQEQLTVSGKTKSVLETTFANAMIAAAQILPNSPTSEQIESFGYFILHLEDLGERIIAEIKQAQAKEAQIIFPASVPNNQVISIFVSIGNFYKVQGLYELAESWHEKCINVCQALFNGDHPDVASSLNNLAALYTSQGRYSQAERLYTQALEMRERLFNGDHPDVASILDNLAALYTSQGRYSQAERLYTQALEMRERLFNGDHPDVACILDNLAALYKSRRRYSKAERLYTQALEMRERLFNGDHPDVASILDNLAALYKSQGRHKQAKPFYAQALEMRKRLFDGDHPDVASSLNNLAALYTSRNWYKKAEPLCTQALEMTKRLFNGDHPNVASSLNNLASLYTSQGRYDQAEFLYTQALEMTKRLFDGDHPDVASSLNNLASLYTSQGRYNQAESLYTPALEMTKRLFDGDHPDVASSLNNLASLYTSRKWYKKAEPLYNQALEMRKRLSDGDHPDVASSLNNLASLYTSRRWYRKAELLYTQALEMTKRLFDDDHSDVASSLNNLASLYKSQGRYKKAESLYTQALAICDRILGVNHPTTATIRENLAIVQRKSIKRWLSQFVLILLTIVIFHFPCYGDSLNN
jgi:tetratricopeptide (TPR) repeat protein